MRDREFIPKRNRYYSGIMSNTRLIRQKIKIFCGGYYVEDVIGISRGERGGHFASFVGLPFQFKCMQNSVALLNVVDLLL